MSIITKNAGLIITKGLGGPACCAILTASFGLHCGCSIEIVVPPEVTGGGGPVAGFYVPLPYKLKQQTRMVLITVKFSEEKVWRQTFVVANDRASYLIKVINFVNKTKERLGVGIEKLQQATVRVITKFKSNK